MMSRGNLRELLRDLVHGDVSIDDAVAIIGCWSQSDRANPEPPVTIPPADIYHN